jgi:hypothetical protein
MSVKKKILLSIPLALILILVVAYIFIDSIAKKAVEVGGEQAMGVPTTLEDITLKPVRGQGSIEGLKVSNPTGFKTPFFMNLSKGDASLDIGSVFTDQVVMNRIALDGIELYLEKTKEGANYKVILENMKKGEEEKPPEPGKKFLVQEVVVSNIVVHAAVAALGAKISTLDVKIDEIRLENVGSETGGGVIMSELMGTIVKAVLVAVLEQGAKLPGAIAEDLGKGLAGLGKVTVHLAGGAVKVVGGAGKAVGGAVKDAGKAIGGIFGGGDDDEEKDK